MAAYKPDLLRESINSILNQSYKNFELIIIDDASPYDLFSIIKEYTDPRIRYYRLQKNAGQSYARNLGVGLAHGEFIAFQDDDDTWDSEKLEIQIENLGENDFCFTAFERNGERWPNNSFEMQNLYEELLKRPLITTGTLLLKKDLFNKVDGFDPGMRNIEDYDLSLRIGKIGKGVYIDKILLHQGECDEHVSGDSNCNEGLRIRCLLFKKHWNDIVYLNLIEEWFSGLMRFEEYCDRIVFEYEIGKVKEFINNKFSDSKFISENNCDTVRKLVEMAVDIGLEFKTNSPVLQSRQYSDESLKIVDDGVDNYELLKIFQNEIAPSCINFSNSNFMGFPDAGNSIAGTLGAVLADFMQQNLINETYCAPMATHMEIEVIKTLRKVAGYDITRDINKIEDVGGIITYGGTGSNCIAMLLARNQYWKLHKKSNNYKVIIPKGIGHYSIGSSLRWLGSGELIEIETNGYRYNLHALEKVLLEEKGNIAAIIAYAGDSRTMTIEYLDQVSKLVKKYDDSIWCHADACHGFSLLFSKELRYKMNGVQNFDSISCDPHKVLAIPYCCGALLLKNPNKFNLISSESDLIMNEPLAFGKITPFIGSKSWVSLKLWFVLKNLGINGIGRMIEKRRNMALSFEHLLLENSNFIILNEVDYNSVVFIWKGKYNPDEVETLNKINQLIYTKMKENGRYYLHQFPIKNLSNNATLGKTYWVLRYMSGNDNITQDDQKQAIDYLDQLGKQISSEIVV